MSRVLNVLVFPCGSEVALEIHRSLEYSIHVKLIGASSAEDHGKFVFKNYIGGLPLYKEPNFLSEINKIIEDNNIDAIYPAMDAVIDFFTENAMSINCKIIASPPETNAICNSKTKTYKKLSNHLAVPEVFDDLKTIKNYPVFLKPDIGYGSRGARKIVSYEAGIEHLQHFPSCIISEFLPGKEYTVDCLTNKAGDLLFAGARERRRTMNGISVNTVPVKNHLSRFEDMARIINANLRFRGAWFFQVKEKLDGSLCLLEVAARLGGSSGLFRNKGVNFALLTVFDAFEIPIDVFVNEMEIEMDRALDASYKTSVDFSTAYVDFDDCLLLTDKVNTKLISLLFQFLNEKKTIKLITKHERDIFETLEQFRLSDIFDEVIHLKRTDEKYLYIKENHSIFIDDSFSERKKIHEKLGIAVFAPDNIDCLFN